MPGQGTGFEKPTEKKMLTYDDFMARLDAHEADPKNPPVYWKASNFASFVRVTPAGGGGTELRWWGSASLMAADVALAWYFFSANERCREYSGEA